MPYVAAVIHPLKPHLANCLVRTLQSLLQRGCGSRDTQHPASRGDHLVLRQRRSGVEDLHPRNAGRVLQSRNRKSRLVAPGVARRTRHHASRCALVPTQLSICQPPIDAGLQGFQQVALKAHENGLSFRIPKPCVELQHLRSTRRHHQSAIQNARERRVLIGHALDRGVNDVAQNPLRHSGVKHGLGGVNAHPPGVRPRIPFADPLMILRRHQRRHVSAVAQAKKADLLAFEKLLNHYLPLRLTQQRAFKKALSRLNRRAPRLADDHALAGSQTISLDHNGGMKNIDRLLQLRRAGAHGVACGGNVVPLQKALGEPLAGLQHGRRPRRTKYPETALAQRVHDTQRQWESRPHNRQFGLLCLHHLDHRIHIRQVRRNASRNLRHPPVARSAHYLRHSLAAFYRPCQRMLAATRSKDQDFHSIASACPGLCRSSERLSSAMEPRKVKLTTHLSAGGAPLYWPVSPQPRPQDRGEIMADPGIKPHLQQAAEQARRDEQRRIYRRNQVFGLLLVAAMILAWCLFHTNPAWIFPPGWWRP